MDLPQSNRLRWIVSGESLNTGSEHVQSMRQPRYHSIVEFIHTVSKYSEQI